MRALPLIAFAAWFSLLYGLLQVLPAVSTWIIEHATVQPAVVLLAWIDPALQARAEGARIVAARGSLQVLPGCEGTDLALLAASAMLAAPLHWRWRLLGVLVALACAALLNQLRLLLLLQAHLRWPAAFGPLHDLWLPLGLVIALATLVLLWTSRFTQH